MVMAFQLSTVAKVVEKEAAALKKLQTADLRSTVPQMD